jgi:hypothetical protein
MGQVQYSGSGDFQPEPSLLARLAGVFRRGIFQNPTRVVIAQPNGLLERLQRARESLRQPAYKLRSAYYRRRVRMVIRHSPEVGQVYATTDGKLYGRQKDGSIRCIGTAPAAAVRSLRAAWSQ